MEGEAGRTSGPTWNWSILDCPSALEMSWNVSQVHSPYGSPFHCSDDKLTPQTTAFTPSHSLYVSHEPICIHVEPTYT